MFAFLVNGGAVVIGALIGALLKKRIKEDICNNVLKAIGAVVLVIGLSGLLKYMLKIENNTISTQHELMLIIVVAVGAFIGELLKIEDKLNAFGKMVEKKLNKSSIGEGFINASIIFCVGAMGIVGSVEAALGNPNVIYLKSAIDAVTALVLASTLGIGVMLSAFSVIIYQGGITIIAYFLGDFMSDAFISVFSMVGYLMVMCIGINFIQKEKIKIANILPALVLVIIYYLIF